MKLKTRQLRIAIFTCLLLSIAAHAGELYRLKPNTVVAYGRPDLDDLMKLNAAGKKQELRTLYNRLKADHVISVAPPGAIVEVTGYYSGSISDLVQIKWNEKGWDGLGYVAKTDLAERVSQR
jgi:hypothetical protein